MAIVQWKINYFEWACFPQFFLAMKASYGIDEIEQIANKIARMIMVNDNDE